MDRTSYESVAIVGPGLIGGSMGMAIRARSLARRVVGIGRRQVSIDKAVEVGAVDEATLDLADGVAGADLVVLATPIRTFARLIPTLAEAMKDGAVLTEVGSTKQVAIRTITDALGERPDVCFIPTHPMAGSERRGPAHAEADLFEGSICIFTPLPDFDEVELERLISLWRSLGARPVLMDPPAHDRLVARISHLPHLVAAALIDLVELEAGEMAGGGLLDTTRIASGDPGLWRDICQTNAGQLVEALDCLGQTIERLRRTIEEERFEDLEEWLRAAKDKRDELTERRARP